MGERLIAQVLHEARPGSGERVLVVVMNSRRDMAIARERGWYRIPVQRAPRQIGADYLAFYLTGAFPETERHRILFYAPIRAYRLVTRVHLLPEEVNHPRAGDLYFKIEIGPVQELARPIPSRRLRRITFIPTTLSTLLRANEVCDLWSRGADQGELWSALTAPETEHTSPGGDV